MTQKWKQQHVINRSPFPSFILLEVEYTPIDLDKLQGDLGGLLEALKVHLQESMEDLINREIQAAIAFADWRYEMEEEGYQISMQIAKLDGAIAQWNFEMQAC